MTDSRSADARVTVVSGWPRSGTSLLMQMLAAGGLPLFADGQRRADADNPRGYHEHALVRRIRAEASWMPQAAGRAVKVVVPLVRHLPPGCRYAVVLVTRDLDQVLASQAAMLRRQGRPAGEPALLRGVYLRQLDECRAALASRHDVALLEVEHRRLLADPWGAARQIAAHVDPSLDLRSMAAAVAPELHRQR